MTESKIFLKKYIIRNFIYHELGSGEIVVQTDQGIVRIHNEKLKRVIIEWDLKSGERVDYEELVSIFKNDIDELIYFLENNRIIEELPETNLSISNIHFITNNTMVFNVFDELFSDSTSIINFNYSFLEVLNVSNLTIENNQLIVVFLNPYNKSFAKSLRNKLQKYSNVHTLFSYIYNGTFYMDGLYNYELKSPCHLCHISYIESNIRNSSLNNVTYQSIVDSIFLEDSQFNIEIPINKIHALTISTIISNRIEKLVMNNPRNILCSEEFLQCLMYDFNKKEIVKDYPIHWELCDCYE